MSGRNQYFNRRLVTLDGKYKVYRSKPLYRLAPSTSPQPLSYFSIPNGIYDHVFYIMFDSTSEPGRYITIIPHEEALAQQQA